MARGKRENFPFPVFYNYPPYFTLQPIKDTRDRQIQLWKELILEYCKQQRIFAITLDDFELFANPSIDRKLSHEATELFVSALVAEGRAEWLDKGHRRALIWWRRIEDWAEAILQFVRENGFSDAVMTLEELKSGDEVRRTELEGLDETVLYRALKLLEQRGKAQMFRGTSADDEGVKFFA